MRLTIGNIYNFKIILKLIWHEDGSYNFQKKKKSINNCHFSYNVEQLQIIKLLLNI